MEGVFQSISQNVINSAQQNNILDDESFVSAPGEFKIPFGRMESGQLIINNLNEIPHMLITGITGSGKSSFVQTMLSVLLQNCTEGDLRVIIYDSKSIDYSAFGNQLHLISPVIMDRYSFMRTLDWLDGEIRERFSRLSSYNTKELSLYNSRCETELRLPRILVIIDDFSMLMLNKDEMTNLLGMINNGRIAGVHFVIVSSLANTKVLPKELISIIPCKITFRLTSVAESRTIIERPGAECLAVPGEMIYRFQNICEKAQSSYAKYENISNVMQSVARKNTSIKSLSAKAGSLFADLMPQQKPVEEMKAPAVEYDEYLAEAGRLVIEKQKGSIGMLQRIFKIGFNRASQIMDQLEDVGVVGPEIGTKPRSILLNIDQWEVFCASKGLNTTSIGEKYSNNEPKQEETEEDQSIKLRDYPEFSVGQTDLSISNNKIKFTKHVKFGDKSGHISPEFEGTIVKKIIYKAPSWFSEGYFTFEFTEEANLKFKDYMPGLLSVDKKNISEVIKVPVSSSNAKTVLNFLTHISEDIGVQITRR